MKVTIACLLACLAVVAAAAGGDRASARVLLVTGIDYPGHKWRETTPVLAEALTNDARLRVDVLEDPYRLDTTDLSQYRAVFLHFMNWERPDPSDKAKENLRRFVERGGGMVMIHFACGAFRDWPEFQHLAGRIYDRTNTHDPRGPFRVDIAKTNHAITRAMTSFEVDDELYICLTGEKPVDVLATARSKLTKRDHPMAFVHSYGKGRVFQTPLGHDVKALRSGQTLELIRRGTLWAAGLPGTLAPAPPRNSRLEEARSPSASETQGLLTSATTATAARVNSGDVEGSFKLPTGFSIQLIAAEPDIVNPMSIAVDDEGALWVTEAHTYRWGTNGAPFRPPTNPIKRITLASDGRGAKSVVALDGFPEPVIGIAAREGKIFATCLNELFVCDVTPDGRLINRKLLIRDAAKPWNPFGMYRVHIGPDDKLWLCIADHPSSEPVTLTGSDGRRVRLAGQSGGLVRCNLNGSALEVIAHGFRAPYAFDIDPWGHIWHISNGEGSPNLYVHVIPGVDYGYASRHASYSWLAGNEPLSPPARDMGAGANTAALHYYSSMFPRQFWGNIFTANWGSHGGNPSNREIVRFRRAQNNNERAGTSDGELVEVGKFLTSTDPKFRPTGLAPAPDGGLYVIDWHGRDDENDRTGRILKIVYEGDSRTPKATAVADFRLRISDLKAEELIAQLSDPNHSIREQARRELVKRGNSTLPLLGKVLASGNAFHAAQTIWTLTRMNTPAAATALIQALKHPDARVRAHALRQLRQMSGQPLAAGDVGVLARVATAAARLISSQEAAHAAAPLLSDPDAEVRVEAALAQDTSAGVVKGLIGALAVHPDRRLAYQIGFQLAHHASATTIISLINSGRGDEKQAALIAIDTARHERAVLFDELNRIAPALLEEAPPAGFAEKVAWLREHHHESLEAEWARLERGEAQLVTSGERIAALEALASFPPRKVPARFIATALDDRDARVQQAALRAIRATGSDGGGFCARTLQLAKTAKPDSIRFEAIWTLAALGNGGATDDWLEFIENRATRTAAIRALRQRENSPALIEALLRMAKSLKGQSGDLAEDLLLTLHALGASIDQCSSAGLELPARDKRTFNAAVIQRVPNASPVLGRLSFHSARGSCSKCHATRSDETSFGPNLSNIGAAAQPEYLVESILDPGKVIKTGFETEHIETTDGQTVSGRVELHGNELRVRISGEERIVLSLDKIHTRTVAPVSPMPEGLDASCSAAELADIVAYVMSLRSGP